MSFLIKFHNVIDLWNFEIKNIFKTAIDYARKRKNNHDIVELLEKGPIKLNESEKDLLEKSESESYSEYEKYSSESEKEQSTSESESENENENES